MPLRLSIFCVLITVFCTRCLGQQAGWFASYGECRAEAENRGLPLLLHFHAWYCGPCQRMDRDVFPDLDIQKTLTLGIAAVKIDVSQEPDLGAQYGASTVPRDVVVFPDGTIETLNVGYMGRGSYTVMLQTVATRGQKMAASKTITPSTESFYPNTATEKPEDAAVATISDQTVDAPIIGLGGYSPVRLHENREWVPGADKIIADFRGIRYHFVDSRELEAFLKSPSRYAPSNLGCDPVLLTTDQKAIAGSIRFGAFFDNRLYLFRTAENRTAFKAAPLKYSRVRTAVRVEQIEGTRFE